ncbi:MAG TPA: polysaccharide pyruvyl transferase family protein [Lacisediminihabitans sp.]|uniref:polysaccharide pyruvyl transferase family protein n=1 Tax=Lacisediminihabitans sp. TaxID=2787631 RepID=UPI002EDB5DE5
MNSIRKPEVYVILTGVSGNLGDAVIRRRVLEWIRGLGQIHAYVGRTTPGWLDQLGIRPGEVVYAAGARRDWLRGLLFGPGKKIMVFDPGEVPLGREHLRSELMFLVIVFWVRLRGGLVFRPPRAIGEISPLTGWLYQASSRLSNVVLWRERLSYERMRVGRLVPDTAFAEPRLEGIAWADRREVVISMRGKREFPSEEWFAGIRDFAASHGFRLVLLSQVAEDEARTRELADRFGPIAEYLPWGDRGDLQQERFIRARYLSCAMAISDRLHVLILAAQAGAMPVEVVPLPKLKVEQHFSTIGMGGISFGTAGRSAADISCFLGDQLRRRDELNDKMAAAANVLENEVQSLRRMVFGRGRT